MSQRSFCGLSGWLLTLILLFIYNSKVDEYQKVHEEASADILQYLSNPINAFRLTKRLTTDWREVETLMLDDVGSSEFRYLLYIRSSF